MQSVYDYLKERNYPGRGILVGMSDDGKKVFSAYFIMGRSENSRNRVFLLDGDRLYTEAFDPSKMEDPSLIIYNCTCRLGNKFLVSNGDQTDTLYDTVLAGGSFDEGMKKRRYEPDFPNFTPRIAAMIKTSDGLGYSLGICRADEDGTKQPGDVRCFFEYPSTAGKGHLIHTYRGEEDGRLLPFVGEPIEVCFDDITAQKLWESLDEQNRVALALTTFDVLTGESEHVIINRHTQGE